MDVVPELLSAFAESFGVAVGCFVTEICEGGRLGFLLLGFPAALGGFLTVDGGEFLAFRGVVLPGFDALGFSAVVAGVFSVFVVEYVAVDGSALVAVDWVGLFCRFTHTSRFPLVSWAGVVLRQLLAPSTETYI